MVGVHLWDNHDAGDRANQALTVIGNLYGVQPDDITGEGLPTIHERHGPTVSPAQRRELQNATVAVMEATNGDQLWQGDGTGTKVNYKGKDYVLTALHLFDNSYTEPLTPRAVDDLTGDSKYYAVADPGLSEKQRDHDNIFGKVIGAAFSEAANAEGPDIALLRIQPVKPMRAKRQFKNIGAIPMAQHLEQPPAPGEPVWMYGVPSPTTNVHAVGGYGTYLGRAMVPGLATNVEQFDVVGLKVDNSSQDACEHGHSGDDFIAPNGFVSGPASIRAPEVSEKVPFGERSWTTVLTATSDRWQIQKALHANLQTYTVLCAFNVVQPSQPKELVKGFGVQLDPYK